MGAISHEVIRPDMVSMSGPQPYTGAVSQPKPAPLGLLLGHLEPFLAPDALYTLVIHPPALTPQKGRDPTVAITTILAGQLDNLAPKCLFIVFDLELETLGGPRLADNLADSSLGCPQSLLQALHATPAALRA